MVPRIFSAALVASLIAAAGCGGPDIPSDALEALGEAEQFELLSLDPSPSWSHTRPADADVFRNWRVLGRTQIDNPATRKQLTDALRAGARARDLAPAACFEPRHGIRVTRAGRTTEFVICFACSQVQVFDSDRENDSFLVSFSPQPTFDAVLQANSVPLPTQ